MRIIDADTVVTIQVYDDVTGKTDTKKMTIAEAIDEWSDEGCPPTVEAVPTDFHDKCQQIEIEKRLKLEEELKERHGHWKKVKSGFDECSVCNYHGSSAFKHCPNCGAKMDEVTE